MPCSDSPINLDPDLDIDIDVALPAAWVCTSQPTQVAVEVSDIAVWKLRKRHRRCHRAFTLETGVVVVVEHTLRAGQTPRTATHHRQTQPRLKPSPLLV